MNIDTYVRMYSTGNSGKHVKQYRRTYERKYDKRVKWGDLCRIYISFGNWPIGLIIRSTAGISRISSNIFRILWI